MSERTYLITGALGCIGAWVVERLLEKGDRPVVFDLGTEPRRIRDLLGATALVVSAAAIALMLGTHQRWVAAVPALLLGVAGLWCARKVIAEWDTTQLSYRLKRRKRLN